MAAVPPRTIAEVESRPGDGAMRRDDGGGARAVGDGPAGAAIEDVAVSAAVQLEAAAVVARGRDGGAAAQAEPQ